MERCPSGHFFDPAKHTKCPHCGIDGLDIDIGPTRAKSAPAVGVTVPVTDGRTLPTLGRQESEGVTVGYYKQKIGLDPVVGWLVCVDGPDRGRDYRIRSERNFIGRDPRMDICISGDDQVSRENHAVVIYDPRNNGFKLAPGDSRGITYHNGNSLDVPSELKPYDAIEVGASRLLFVPFCGDHYQWQ